MKVTLVVKSRFQFFHLARQLEKKQLFDKIYTGYPKFKLRDEKELPIEKIITYPWFVASYMGWNQLGLNIFDWLEKDWQFINGITLDNYVAKRINQPGVLISMSGNGLKCGSKMQSLGGKYICQRGSTHIEYQNDLLFDEYQRWGFKWKGIDERIINYELSEYEQADRITVPSEFAFQSFLKMGIPKSKLVKIPYGGRLDRFKKIDSPSKDKFSVLWVGEASLRKGFMYALEAFEKLKHPAKEFIVIGSISDEIKILIKGRNLEYIFFKGTVPNIELINYYNKANAFVMPSIEDGFGIVLSEALACGCPVIATPNSGSVDLFTDSKEGFIVPIQNSQAIKESFEKLLDSSHLRNEMGQRGIEKVESFGGWDEFGKNFEVLIKGLR